MVDSNSSILPNLSIDSSNPLYLHPSDHPGMILVSKFFSGTGFGAWKSAIKIALSAKKKLGFTSNTLTMPILWNELNTRYGQANRAKFYQLQKNHCQITQGSSAAQLFAKREEDQRLIKFLVGLTPSYDMIKINILMMQQLLSISHACGILIQDEKQKEIHTITDFIASSASMYASSEAPTSGGTRENKRALVYSHCKKNGHSINKCYKLIGFPKNLKLNKGMKFTNLADDQGKMVIRINLNNSKP
ncbi:uncharacterized protein LOC143594490 [Bidens hawaiensis]|uniref:uncharacterized protein LOC143594490 n=1 Tax=Bidens hawaiensis TaxID=980011 RepID=UPI00404903DE